MPYLPPKDSPNFKVTAPLKYFVSFLQTATYFCLGLTIAIAFDVKQAINGNSEAKVKLHRSKEVRPRGESCMPPHSHLHTFYPFLPKPDFHLPAAGGQLDDLLSLHHSLCHGQQGQLQPRLGHLAGEGSDKVYRYPGRVHLSPCVTPLSPACCPRPPLTSFAGSSQWLWLGSRLPSSLLPGCRTGSRSSSTKR